MRISWIAIILGVVSTTGYAGVLIQAAGLKEAVIEAKSKLGALDEVEQKIFNEEVLPQYQPFIHDYRPATSGVSAEVDLEALRKFLDFRAAPAQKRRISVYLKPEGTCGHCIESLVAVRKLVQESLTRRGFLPVWLTPEDLGAQNSSIKNINDRVKTISSQKGDFGVLVLQWQEAPLDDLDNAHADEKHYQAFSYVIAEHDSYEGQLELTEEDSFEVAVNRLLTSSFIALGAKSPGGTAEKEDLLIQVSGVQDFNHFNKIKNLILTGIPSITSLEERKISRGEAVFSARTSKNLSELKQLLAGLKMDSGKWNVVNSSEEHLIKVEIQ